MKDLKVGDPVYATADPETIMNVTGETTGPNGVILIRCQWRDAKKGIQQANFPEAALKKADLGGYA